MPDFDKGPMSLAEFVHGINEHRLYFDGTAAQLFGKWLLWLFLTIITVGIYGLWVTIRIKQWKIKHTWFNN